MWSWNDGPNRSNDIALTNEFRAREVIDHPANARDGDEKELNNDRKERMNNEAIQGTGMLTICFRLYGAWILRLKNNEYIGTVRNAAKNHIINVWRS
jgi:hypothetical protein